MPFKKTLNTIIFIAVFIGGFVFYPNKAFLYSGMPTHYNLAKEMVELYNLAYDPDITPAQLERILKGSLDEDTPPRWAYHLYDPIYNRAPYSEWGVHTAKQWALDYNIQELSKIGFASVIYKFVNGDFEYHGNYSWPASVNYAASGDYDQAYYGLGHILHLIGDMSVPAHTRDDPHLPGNLDPLETWTAKIDYSSDYNANLAENLYKNKILPKQIYTLGQAFDELALYSNQHFFSLDSLPQTDLSKDYYNPVIIMEKQEEFSKYIKRTYGWGRDENRKLFRLTAIQEDYASSKKNYFIDSDDTNLQTDYWTHLAPKAVQYGAGVIKLFLDQIGTDVTLANAADFTGRLPMSADVIQPQTNQGEVRGASTENPEPGTAPETSNQNNKTDESDKTNNNPKDGSIVVSGPSTAGNSWEAPKTTEPQDTLPPIPLEPPIITSESEEEEPTPPEPIPGPAKINDLSIAYENNIFITLQWTAPYENGTYTSPSYDIRYSDAPIIEENWDMAKPISDFNFSQEIPDVQNPETIQRVDITPLEFNSTYYFAIKTSDGMNTSEISNVVEYSTDAAPSLMKSVWPVFQKNQQSTGFVPYSGPDFVSSESINIKWTAQIQNPIYTPLVMDTDGILYGGGEKGLYAIDSRNGELKWFYDTYNYEQSKGGINYSAALTSDGTIYFCSYGGTYLYALTSTGKLKWKYQIAGPNDGGSAPIVGSDGTIYVTSREQGYVYAINPNGTKRWEYLISDSRVNSSPVMGSDGTIYVAWRNFGFVGYVSAIDSEGNLKWQSENINPNPYAGLSIDANDNIYVGSYYNSSAGYLNSLKFSDGSVNWSNSVGGMNVPANIDGSGKIYAANEGGNIYFLNADDIPSGAIYVGTEIYSPLVVDVTGTIYFASKQKLFAFNPDGSEKWSYEFSEKIMASPIIDDNGTIYVATSNGKLWAIGD